MLSRVAERVYWTGRYLERIESTARLVSIYDNLLFDVPRTYSLGWYNLIVINSLEHDFKERYAIEDERNVVKFMLRDESNPCSVVASLKSVRENVRTTREVLPERTWERINELSMFVRENVQQQTIRSNRHEFLEQIIIGCQQLQGLLNSNMPHDEAWLFLRLGNYIERADMTIRNIEAGLATVKEREHHENIVNIRQIIWGNVLRSLSAEQAYRRTMRCAVHSETVIEYLLVDQEFPRSFGHCLFGLIESCTKLPHSKDLVAELKVIQDNVESTADGSAAEKRIRKYLNQLQLRLENIHQIIGEMWFSPVS